jgi:glycosyltransferase involved in cell wall biosynthesis
MPSSKLDAGDLRKSDTAIGAVVIGRNEGARLKQCLASLSGVAMAVYVDSGSTDGSADWARKNGVEVVILDTSRPFTAARARNAGFMRLRELLPKLTYVQFVDGDCELNCSWLKFAGSYLDLHAKVGAVCGHRRERFPDRSTYNWLCDQEWNGPVGEARAFGGDVLMRVGPLVDVGGYRDDVIAAEDDELSVRLRAAGWRIWRLDAEMTLHDAAMMHFHQWWRRAQRTGYAFALLACLHGRPPERYFVWESRRARLWGVWLPLTCLIATFYFWPWGTATWLIFPIQTMRQILRNQGPLRRRAVLAFFQLLARFPEAFGQVKFMQDRLLRRRAHLIEYK